MSESSSLQKQQALPEHFKKYAGQDFSKAMGDMTPADYGINFLKICQDMSPESKPGWHPTDPAYFISPGAMFLSISKRIVEAGTKFVPLYRKRKYIKWKGKRPGQGMEFQTDDPMDPRIVRINGLAFGQAQDGTVEKPSVTEYLNFYIMLQGEDTPVLLSFHTSFMKKGQLLTQQINQAKRDPKLPPYLIMFEFQKTTIDKFGNPSHNIIPAGFTPKDYLPNAEKLFKEAALFAEQDEIVTHLQAMETSTSDSERATIDGEVTVTGPFNKPRPKTEPSPVSSSAPAPQQAQTYVPPEYAQTPPTNETSAPPTNETSTPPGSATAQPLPSAPPDMYPSNAGDTDTASLF